MAIAVDQDTIDLSRYQSEQIVARLADMLSIPQTVRTLLTTMGYTVVLLIVVHAFIFSVRGQAGIPWLIASVYVLFIAVLLALQRQVDLAQNERMAKLW